MSRRIDPSWLVFISIENDEHDRCVDLFERPNATFGFEAFRRDVEDRGAWTPLGYYAEQVFATAEAALTAAIAAIPWLGDAVERHAAARTLLKQ